MRRLVVDVDGTLSHAVKGDYYNAQPDSALIEKLKSYKDAGFEIVLATARNMRTYQGNVGKINALTLPTLIEWLDRHDVPYDEIWVGKPWNGYEGFYVDDKAIRPDEFKNLSYDEIMKLTSGEGA